QIKFLDSKPVTKLVTKPSEVNLQENLKNLSNFYKVAEQKLKKALARASLLEQRIEKCKQAEDTSAFSSSGT
ncbi:hypothetical protein Tco_1297885, partial [Tanacetum coccineum]